MGDPRGYAGRVKYIYIGAGTQGGYVLVDDAPTGAAILAAAIKQGLLHDDEWRRWQLIASLPNSMGRVIGPDDVTNLPDFTAVLVTDNA